MGGSAKKERVRAALAGRAVDRVPTSLWGHDFLREWEPRDLAGATLEDYRAHDWDFIKLNPRSTYFAEAWGNTYDRPSEQRQPRLLRPAVQGIEDLAALRAVDPVGGVFAEHLTALRLVLEEVGDEVDVIQTIFSPLGVAGALCGGEAAFREHAAADPAAAHHALSVIGGVLDAYAAASIDAGSAGIFYAPLAWASHDTCTEPFYREFGRPYDLQLLHRVRGAPFNVLHVCRNHNMIGLLLDYPVAALNWADRGVGNPSTRGREGAHGQGRDGRHRPNTVDGNDGRRRSRASSLGAGGRAGAPLPDRRLLHSSRHIGGQSRRSPPGGARGLSRAGKEAASDRAGDSSLSVGRLRRLRLQIRG